MHRDLRVALQSTVAPDSFTIFAHRTESSFNIAASCSGVPEMISAPCAAIFSCRSCVARALTTSALSLAVISFGVPAGAKSPTQSSPE